MRSPDLLSPEQRQAYKDILRRKVLGLASDCGFGKTIVCLTSFVVLLRKRPDAKLLVVCTPKGVTATWRTEHKDWEHTQHLRVSILAGTPKQRVAALQQEADAYVISYNNLRWLYETNKGRSRVKFIYVFADEGDCLKGGESKWRAYLLRAAPAAIWKVISSATPKTREEDDYWGLCKYLDNGKALGTRTLTQFREKYCKPYPLNNRVLYRINKKMIPELERRIAPLFRRYALSDSATIPIKTITCYANLSPEAAEKYNLLLTEQCINSIVYDGIAIDRDESLDAMILSGKLAQLSNGFLYIDENVRITKEVLEKATDVKALLKATKKRIALDIFDDRIRAFGRMIKTIHRKHGRAATILITYFHSHELVQLQRVLPTGVADTSPTFQEDWQAGKIQYGFLQYSRSSKSLNLQAGGHIMAFYSPTWKWVDDYQIIRRLARQGQKAELVYAYRLYMRGTIDDKKTKKLGERFMGHSRFQKKILQTLVQPL